MAEAPITLERRGRVLVVSIDRPHRRNAVDRATAEQLFDAFRAFGSDDSLAAAVLTGRGGVFCAGADLLAIADGDPNLLSTAEPIIGTLAPMGPTRLELDKPVIAAVEGYAVAGGLELATWCDLRVAADDAVLGVFSRRFGVPLIDGGTVRLPRLIGQSNALDLILTGRAVPASEALRMGLVNRIVPAGTALDEALGLAAAIAEFPPGALRHDLRQVRRGGSDLAAALVAEARSGAAVLAAGEPFSGARAFAAGAGRHGGPGA